ncbi:hypothetical protein, unknown function [Leishmania infantum JPCM5]|uniref:Uncharacterized protein n=3 Tax=Leishmania donovani species complex TaxID=38574 RepID=A4I429_LEIIN|nr:hypothetical protein, unknown function [Leishmania infantum JPCM5]XP_003862411.1 hypothetical protein, unknown function [Leishmania donovani]CAC9505926.1 hypothetical_protein_-_conserved [Leishmania infantum]AYU80474.1 hypothetical protein LdCL_280037000 [Leishmania donovani]TPP54438.1 hypothetical protein CGC21_22985 [Leishmania donovani]CAM69536.1 hypothetical protein, unknown function [Leishmania infantum JPCM5]CBZ35717.1 hypothetical protein, unknown function [Leishmania donovani]|eukprot:XP_001470341.1 hypothetical protein, unknown function [Leishmania infantum JPCM5]
MSHASAKAFRDGAEPLPDRSASIPRETASSLTWLEANAAVRLDTLNSKSFDCYGLPLRQSGKDGRPRFSLMKSVKKLGSYLTTRINRSFQACLIRVVESESNLTFEVRELAGGKFAKGRLLFVAPLSTLVDVASDSVMERDAAVFARFRSPFHSAAGHSNVLVPLDASTNRNAPCTAITSSSSVSKEEGISTLSSAYGGIGLLLVFRAAQANAVNPRHSSSKSSSASHTAAPGGGAVPYTRVRLCFVSTGERNTWMSFCAEAYVGLLLDSVRTGRDTVFVADDDNHPSSVAATSLSISAVTRGDIVHTEKPTQEAIACYIDFFLSVSAKGDACGGSNGSIDRIGVPLKGLLKVRGADGALHNREVQVERMDGVNDARLPAAREFLVLWRKRWFGKQVDERIELETLAVYAKNDLSGTAFYLEFPHTAAGMAGDGAASTERTSLLGPMEPTEAHGMMTLECEAGSFSRRLQWLQWLEATLKRPVIFLSVERREAQTPVSAEQGLPNELPRNRVVR